MNVLVLNGSPKGERSNTLRLTNAFCAGIAQAVPCSVTTLPLCKMDIRDCTGCFGCWKATPVICHIHDDMAGILAQLRQADCVIWSFPLYYFSLPSRLKAVMDRQLPLSLPYMEGGAPYGGHPSRYDRSAQRYAAISTCGFYTPNGNYNAVDAQFSRMYGADGYTPLYCGEGELFRVPALKSKTDAYLRTVQAAGREFADGGVSPSIRAKLAEPLYPRAAYEQMANAEWGDPCKQESPHAAPDAGEESLRFTKQMAALYKPSSWKGRDTILEFYYTDIGRTYQLCLTREGQTVGVGRRAPYTTRIETPLSVWKRIAAGELSGAQALLRRLYRVKGSLTPLLRWNSYFG